MGKRKDNAFWESMRMNNRTYIQYYNRLMELAISQFEWKNLPTQNAEKPGIDERFLELTLFADGWCVFFEDEVLGYLALQATISGNLNVYRIPTKRRAYAVNGYQKELDNLNSVCVFNNYLHENSMLDVEMFAKRLYNIDRIIDVNVNSQKTPYIITCDENSVLTAKNFYKQVDGNEQAIFGQKNLSGIDFKVLKTDAPFVADKLYNLKAQIWNEALTYLGISNTNVTKKERMNTDEVNRSLGGTLASRNGRLAMRRKACEEINNMFGLNVSVDFRENFSEFVSEVTSEVIKNE